MMMSNNMENVAPHVIKNVSRQVKCGKCMFLYLYLHLYLYGTLEQYVQEMGVITFVWSFKGDVQVHSLVQEKMEGISIEVIFDIFFWS